ncbi:MAG: PAS domain S-box protein [Acidobacteriota bacterium]
MEREPYILVADNAEPGSQAAAIGMLRRDVDRVRTVCETQSCYKNLFMTIGDAALIYEDESGEILDANQAGERLYGYTHEEFLRMNVSALNAAGASGHRGESPLRYHRKRSGSIFPVEVSTGMFEWRGRRCRFDICRDLTERRKEELELRRSEARLNLYLNAMHDGLCDWNVTTGELFLSPGWFEMLGYTSEEVPPYVKYVKSIIHRDDLAAAQDAFDRHCAGTTTQFAAEFRMRTKMQDWKWVGCRGSVVEWSADGTAHRLIATFADISERKAAEERLRHIAHENRLLMDHASDAIIITSAGGRIMDANPKACEFFEYSRAELLGRQVSSMVPPEELAVRPLPFELLRSGNPVVEERTLRKKSGALMIVESSLKALPDGRIHASMRNITERKRAENEFKSIVLSEVYEKLFIKLRVFRHGESMAMNLNRLLLFAQNIADLHALLRKHSDGDAAAHLPAAQRVNVAVNEYNLLVYPELRSIGLLLQAIADEQQSADSGPLPGASGRELLKLNENVRRLIGQMKDLVCDPESDAAGTDEVKTLRRHMLRDVDLLKAHVSSLMKRVESELSCDVKTVAAAAVNRYTPNAPGVQVLFRDSMPAARCAIGKAAEIGEIISILIHNAIEAIEADTAAGTGEKRVTVECLAGDGKITILVEDNGPGVSPELREKIFEDGFTTKSDGHGFGLSYARAALLKYGGKISCRVRESRGAQFMIELAMLP